MKSIDIRPPYCFATIRFMLVAPPHGLPPAICVRLADVAAAIGDPEGELFHDAVVRRLQVGRRFYEWQDDAGLFLCLADDAIALMVEIDEFHEGSPTGAMRTFINLIRGAATEARRTFAGEFVDYPRAV